MPRTNRIGITIGGTRYFMAFVSKRVELRTLAPFSGTQGLAVADHSIPTRIAAPSARQPSAIIVCNNFLLFASG
jgi:hypothetical protein